MSLLANISLILCIVAGIYVYRLLQLPTEPDPVVEEWWGADESKPNDNLYPKIPQKFQISIADEVLSDLNKRLQMTRPPTPSLKGANFTYGFNSGELLKIANYWKNEYSWRNREKALNKFEHFKINVQGLKLHYIHVQPKPSGKKRFPLLLLHGWPGSFREFVDLLPYLQDDSKDFQFELIVPSLPGYGFSQGATRPGLGPLQVAAIMKNLMVSLGHPKFIVHGGDWGGIIGSHMATLYPQHVIGFHSTMCSGPMSLVTHLNIFIGSYWPSFVVDEKNAHKMYPFSEKFQTLLEEMGYLHIQATKPDTVGIALTDSPMGLAAYILEKYSTWTNLAHRNEPDGALTKRFSLDTLLDTIMIYWSTGSITTSMRIYAENFNKREMSSNVASTPTSVPTVCVRFSHDLMYHSDKLIRYKYTNLLHSHDVEDGGHFPALEHPKILAESIWHGVQKIGNFYHKPKTVTQN